MRISKYFYKTALWMVAVASAAAPARAQGEAGAQPSAPATQPSAPATQPSAPATQPADAQPAAQADGLLGQVMTLGQVLQVAVRQKPDLALAAIDIQIADAAVLEAAGLDDWILDASASWVSSRFRALNIDQDTVGLSGSLSRSLSTGGTVSLHAETNYTRTSTDLYDDTISVSLTHPLLRGRGRAIARAAQRRARLGRDAAVLSRDAQAIAAVQEVIVAYWELAYALRDLDIRKASLELAEERLKNTRAGIDAGAVAPTEALAVMQTIATRRQEIATSELIIMQRSLRLRRLAGLEIGPGATGLTTAAPLAAAPAPAFDLDALLQKALSQSPELAALELQAQQAWIDVELTENGLLPQLDAALSFGPTGSADSFGTALSNMVTFDDVSINASLRLNHTLGNRAAKGADARARARHVRQRVTMGDVKAQIASALALAVKQAEAAQVAMALSREIVELAEKNIETEKARFELGRATNFDVLQRQSELQFALLSQARAIVDYLEAVTAIDAITGEIFGKYGITLDTP